MLKKKEQTYRGLGIEELKKMDIREFAKLLKSNERRTIMRQYGEIERFLLRFNKKTIKGKQIRTHQRELVIVPKMVGLKINVHNGKEFFPVDITIDMLGNRLGEFAVTRSKVKHGAAGIGATRSSASASVK
ncbi:ribosomal protein S19 family protein [Candidatus Pacearchaeota archaeon]|nr:ribosomal protein S19 family protein [Candidatus Pacearchaeota archaeon]